MKKSIINLLVMMTFITFYTLISCNEENKTAICTTCESEDFEMSEINLLGKSFNLKSFKSESDNSVFMYQPQKNFNELEYILKYFETNGVMPIKRESVLGVVIYTKNQEDSKNHNYIIKGKEINGILIYLKDKKSDNIIAKIFKNINGHFIENKLSNSKTRFVSTNDMYMISSLLFDQQINTTISFIDFYNLPKNRYPLELQDKLKGEMKLTHKAPRPDCGRPCEMGGGEDCTGYYDEGYFPMWYCETSICSKNSVEDKLFEANYSNYDYTNIDNVLHSFKNNYLFTHEGGQNYITMYYNLSGTLPMENLTIPLCLETMDLIISDVMPLASNIESNPNLNSNILITTETKNRIISYLNKIRDVYNDQDSKNKIDQLIIKIEFFSNKSNNFITSNL